MTKKTGVKNRRLLFAKNSIMMLVMLVIIFLAIFAWYYIQRNVSATGVSIKAANPGEVEIAITQNGADDNVLGNWVENETTHEIEWSPGTWSDKVNFRGPFEFSNDVTSNGTEFIIPAFSSTEDNDDAKADARENGKIVNVNGIPKTGDQVKTNLSNLDEGETADYVKIPFFLRSNNPDLYVMESAYLAMAVENGVYDGTNNEKTEIKADSETDPTIPASSVARKSAYGDFSSDAVVAAMRVSITGCPIQSVNNTTGAVTMPQDPEFKSSFVWVPRPDLFLNIPDGSSEDDWTLQTGVQKNTSLTRNGGSLPSGTTYKHSYYSIREDNSHNIIGVVKEDNDTTDNSAIAYKSDITKKVSLENGDVPTLGQGKEITSSLTPILYGGYYYYKFYLNLWIEGTDTEARRAMDTGKFSLYMEFNSSGGN